MTALQIHTYNATLFAGLVAMGVIDQYGSWIINYTGTQPVQIPSNVYVHHGGF